LVSAPLGLLVVSNNLSITRASVPGAAPVFMRTTSSAALFAASVRLRAAEVSDVIAVFGEGRLQIVELAAQGDFDTQSFQLSMVLADRYTV
jgi:hypothetical protein